MYTYRHSIQFPPTFHKVFPFSISPIIFFVLYFTLQLLYLLSGSFHLYIIFTFYIYFTGTISWTSRTLHVSRVPHVHVCLLLVPHHFHNESSTWCRVTNHGRLSNGWDWSRFPYRASHPVYGKTRVTFPRHGRNAEGVCYLVIISMLCVVYLSYYYFTKATGKRKEIIYSSTGFYLQTLFLFLFLACLILQASKEK